MFGNSDSDAIGHLRGLLQGREATRVSGLGKPKKPAAVITIHAGDAAEENPDEGGLGADPEAAKQGMGSMSPVRKAAELDTDEGGKGADPEDAMSSLRDLVNKKIGRSTPIGKRK